MGNAYLQTRIHTGLAQGKPSEGMKQVTDQKERWLPRIFRLHLRTDGGMLASRPNGPRLSLWGPISCTHYRAENITPHFAHSNHADSPPCWVFEGMTWFSLPG